MYEFFPWQNDPWHRWTGLRTRLAHGLLLRGPQGVGKFNFAMNMAQSLLCQAPLDTGLPCQDCPSCHWFHQGTHPDFYRLQPAALTTIEEEKEASKKPARQITVDQIRELSDFSSLSAHQGGHRIILIHPAETMNANAANALLKTLEEPTRNLLIILVSHKPQQLLPTILSRCIALAMPVPPTPSSIAWLQQQGVTHPHEFLAMAGFAPLKALTMANEATDTAENSLFFQQIGRASDLDSYTLAEKLLRIEPVQVIHWMQQWCYDLVSAKLSGKIRYNQNY